MVRGIPQREQQRCHERLPRVPALLRAGGRHHLHIRTQQEERGEKTALPLRQVDEKEVQPLRRLVPRSIVVLYPRRAVLRGHQLPHAVRAVERLQQVDEADYGREGTEIVGHDDAERPIQRSEVLEVDERPTEELVDR